MMVNPFAELPLAVFTTLMPLAAGAFLGVLLMVICERFGEAALRRLDRAAALPVALLLVGFVGAFFHLHDPLHAAFAVTHIGASPLTNEILVACLFAFTAAAYLIAGLLGKLTGSLRRAWLMVLAVLGAVLAVFTGLAYRVSTIPAWATPLVPVEMLGYYLAAAPLAAVGARFAGVELGNHGARALFAAAVAGVVVAVVATVAHALFVCGLAGVYETGACLVAAAVPWYVAAAALAVAYLAVCAVSLRGKVAANKVWLAVMLALLVAAVFCARLAFYCLRLNVGI